MTCHYQSFTSGKPHWMSRSSSCSSSQGQGFSPNVKCRGAMLKVMKTVRSIEERVGSEPTCYLVQGLVTQLIEMMPELASVDAWPSVAKRRTGTEISPLEERAIPAGLFDGCEWSELE